MAQATILYPALATPVNAAFATATTGGTLAADTYYYRVSALGSGGETQASAETSQATAVLATPVNAAFSTATTGGTLAEGTYSYRVAAKNAFGSTLASTATTQATTGATSTVTVNWGAVSGATGYDVFGRIGGSELLIASVGAVTTYTDTGAITPAGALPTSNTTGTNTNTLTVNWTAVAGATGYKIYGRTAGGQLLIAEVGAVTTYVDTGAITPAGALPTTNNTGILAATSADIVVAAGSNATIGIFAGAEIPLGVEIGVWADTPSEDALIATLSRMRPATVLAGPGTFRAKRGDISQYGVSVGVFTES